MSSFLRHECIRQSRDGGYLPNILQTSYRSYIIHLDDDDDDDEFIDPI